jgi:hypothetical protein
MKLRLWRLLGARRGKRDAKAIVVGKVVGTEIVAIAIMIPSAIDIVMRERMIADTVIIGASVGIDLGRQLRQSDLIANTAASETVNTTVIAERIDAGAMTVTVEMTIATVEAIDLAEATATAMVKVTAVTTERRGIPTLAKLETEIRVLGVTVIMTARDPPDDHHLAEAPLLRSEPNPATIVATTTDETTLAAITIIAMTHTIEIAAHLLPAPHLASQIPSSRRKNASASLRKCNQTLVRLKQNDASGFLRSVRKSRKRRRLMISYALTVVNSCPRYISVCRKIAWMNAFGAVEVDCPRWRRIKDF